MCWRKTLRGILLEAEFSRGTVVKALQGIIHKGNVVVDNVTGFYGLIKQVQFDDSDNEWYIIVVFMPFGIGEPKKYWMLPEELEIIVRM